MLVMCCFCYLTIEFHLWFFDSPYFNQANGHINLLKLLRAASILFLGHLGWNNTSWGISGYWRDVCFVLPCLGEVKYGAWCFIQLIRAVYYTITLAWEGQANTTATSELCGWATNQMLIRVWWFGRTDLESRRTFWCLVLLKLLHTPSSIVQLILPTGQMETFEY